VELGSLDGEPFTFAATYERTVHPARGREGGEDGCRGALHLANSGEQVKPIGQTEVPAGERLVIAFPGGGGYGPPSGRSPAAIEAEARAGLLDAPTASNGAEVRPVGANGQNPVRG
jgi:N-methylhydantoinase B